MDSMKSHGFRRLTPENLSNKIHLAQTARSLNPITWCLRTQEGKDQQLTVFQGDNIMTVTAAQSAVTQEAQDHSEGIVARTIEQQTAKLPSDIFLWGALGSIGVSLFFELKGNAEKSRFVGQWVSPFLLLGVYNKLVKLAGSDRVNR